MYKLSMTQSNIETLLKMLDKRKEVNLGIAIGIDYESYDKLKNDLGMYGIALHTEGGYIFATRD